MHPEWSEVAFVRLGPVLNIPIDIARPSVTETIPQIPDHP